MNMYLRETEQMEKEVEIVRNGERERLLDLIQWRRK